ncbi:cytochrome c-type biogenesis protein CcmF [Sphingomonas jejuensis]|uniref:Cytochrome c-type biogenesis protein CcmF n=1 Tax=Sphingomonas jejuensis TaxID=904715 RepID=A0ABX0XKB6_9SPHN|nr:heme lyase CcmF/NrfE family subunit [Sphingomonas jejuensis]NJC33294.1 cytochrome c-type biogenesis protein CcmF [Sphingomonas jejuensis]
MIAEVGHAALWVAAALALAQLIFAAAAFTMRGAALADAVRPVAIVQGLAAVCAFAMLAWLFSRTDLSVLLVALNSHVDKPWLYKIAGTWGNHEGSMLLWVAVLGAAGAAYALLERQLAARTTIATLGAQAAIALGFYAFLLIASNPFTRLNPPAATGLGLNPILQDPGLAFHPPTLYLGYVGLSIAFSIAVGALVTRDVGPDLAKAMRPWVLGAWVLLTLGITAGSYWAYYELGWGGWWFWDPVENASLMPWLAATALLHSISVLAARGALRAWTVMLAVLAFSMSMVGTFLVRSGILTSVHAFAVDPARGSFILALLVIYIGGALALFGWRVGTVRQGATFTAWSREGSLVLNNLLLTAILGIVLVGTLYPLAIEALGLERVSVGPPYFNAATAPLALALMVAMVAGPLIRWRRDDWRETLAKLRLPAGLAVLVAAVVWIAAGWIGLLPLLGLAIAAAVAAGSVAPLWGRNLRRTPLFTWGMVVSHLGVAVSVAGMASESAFTQEVLVAARAGEVHEVGPFRVRFVGIEPISGPNFTALQAVLYAGRRGGAVHELKPQARSFWNPPTETREAALLTSGGGQLYAVLGRQESRGRWQLRLWWKPWVTLIWGGGALIAAGAALSILGRVTRRRRRADRTAYA